MRTYMETSEYPLGDAECKHPEFSDLVECPTSINPLMSSEDWLKQPRFAFVKEILDPDGWDRENFSDSWFEHITGDEMERRVCESTVAYNFIPGVPDRDGKHISGTVPWPEIAKSDTPPKRLDAIFGRDDVPPTPHGVTLKALHKKLLKAWSKETSSLPLQWSPENPARGQSVLTAILVHYHVGGMIIECLMNHGIKHYWNVSKQGETFDLTRGQFTAGFQIVDATVADVTKLLMNKDICERYILLLKRLSDVTFETGGYAALVEDIDITVDTSGPLITKKPFGAPLSYIRRIDWQEGEDDVVPLQELHAMKMKRPRSDPGRKEAGDINFEITRSDQGNLMEALLRPGLTVEVDTDTGKIE